MTASSFAIVIGLLLCLGLHQIVSSSNPIKISTVKHLNDGRHLEVGSAELGNREGNRYERAESPKRHQHSSNELHTAKNIQEMEVAGKINSDRSSVSIETRENSKISVTTIESASKANLHPELPASVEPPSYKRHKSVPTATGGLVYTLLVFLTGVAFVGNGAFLIYVFWLAK